MYGPRPGDRVCKVNFSRLTDEEKQNTNLVLAKQDHDIVFEEENGFYVANVKFVKSPGRPYTGKTERSGSPKKDSPSTFS